MLNTQELLAIRQKFPFFDRQQAESAIIYLDNAATTQKPALVIECLTQIWENGSANVHRSSHTLANQLTERYENARNICASFINAQSSNEIVWTTGATEAINLIAHSWGRQNIQSGDVILITAMEHHANLLPWQQLCLQTGATLKVIPVLESAELDLQLLDTLLKEKVKLLAITHVSNVLGTINPIQQIIARCHQYNCKVLVDGAQAMAHLPIDVQQLDCDFYVCSGHKCFAPEGTGFLYGKKALLDAMPPWKTGGEMVKSVAFHSATYQPTPLKFEAGTPNISATIAFAQALLFLQSHDRIALLQHEKDLTALAELHLSEIAGLQRHSTAEKKSSIVALTIEGCQSMDLAALLDEQNIAVRSGHLCAMPLVKKLTNNGILRASFCFYNSADEVMAFVAALKQSVSLLRD